MSPRTARILLVLSAFLAGLVLFTGAVFFIAGPKSLPPATLASAVGGPFELVDQDGRKVTDADLKGRPTLMFFGFTHCPDICPTTLFDVSEVFRALGDGKEAAGYFVTVDPERDTPAVLKDYLSSFDPRIRGLSGTPAQIEAIEKAYRVYAKKVPTGSGDYTMDHSALVYLMDKDGRFVAPFNLKRKPEEAAADLRRYF
ncbi:MAG TPA: SCO family protein [Pseudorhodoplanes sp.]|jgi:protein SCO1/2|nr:SCO family protein [Pseudorhodoplanes sp.]